MRNTCARSLAAQPTRELLEHVIVLGEQHLLRLVRTTSASNNDDILMLNARLEFEEGTTSLNAFVDEDRVIRSKAHTDVTADITKGIVPREPIERDAKRPLEHHRPMRERQLAATPLGTRRRRRARDGGRREGNPTDPPTPGVKSAPSAAPFAEGDSRRAGRNPGEAQRS